MGFKWGNPGCPCCDDDCRIDITSWNQVAETWTIAGDNLETASSSALAVTTNEHPDELSTHYVTVSVKGDTDGDILRVIVAYTDSNNYLYAEIEVGTTCGYLRLFQVTSGSAFQLGDDVPSLDLTHGVFHTVRVCYDGETLTAIVVNKVSYSQDVTATGTYVGVATGAITTLATFNNFGWWIHYDDGGYYADPNDCPECDSLIPCTIASDSFSRTDGSDLGCEWNTISGSWAISSHQLVAISSGLVLNLIPHPIPGDASYASVSAEGQNEGDTITLLLDSDGVGYHAVQLLVGEVDTGNNGKVRLLKSGTILKEDDFNVIPGTNYNLKLCVFDGVVIGVAHRISTSISISLLAESVAIGGEFSGLAGSTDAVFDYFLYSRHESDDPSCPKCSEVLTGCMACIDGEVSNFYKITVQGLVTPAFDPYKCDCEALNGTLILAYNDTFGACQWRNWVPDIDVCEAGGIRGDSMRIWTDGTKKRITFSTYQTTIPGSNIATQFMATFGDAINHPNLYPCLEFDEQEVPPETRPGGHYCNQSNAMLKVTTL